MENICHHLLNMNSPYNEEDFTIRDAGGIYNCKTPTITELIEVMDEMIGTYTDLEVIEENVGKEGKPFIKFRYNGLECEICENYDTYVVIKAI